MAIPSPIPVEVNASRAKIPSLYASLSEILPVAHIKSTSLLIASSFELTETPSSMPFKSNNSVIFMFYSPFNCARHSSMKSLFASEYEKAVAPPHAVPKANASS